MLLDDKHAVIYGGGGPIGGAVARSFAREGARVFLADAPCRPSTRWPTGSAPPAAVVESAVVDALDAAAVEAGADAVAAAAGGLDISFDLISVNDVQGTPLVEMAVEDFLAPIRHRHAHERSSPHGRGAHMITQGLGGVILAFGGRGDPMPCANYSIGGFQIALHAVEALRRQLAAELGKHGVRVVTPADRRPRRQLSGGLRGPRRAGRSLDRADAARSGRHARRTSATSPRSSLPTSPAR